MHLHKFLPYSQTDRVCCYPSSNNLTCWVLPPVLDHFGGLERRNQLGFKPSNPAISREYSRETLLVSLETSLLVSLLFLRNQKNTETVLPFWLMCRLANLTSYHLLLKTIWHFEVVLHSAVRSVHCTRPIYCIYCNGWCFPNPLFKSDGDPV